jgi:hypothetical protein
MVQNREGQMSTSTIKWAWAKVITVAIPDVGEALVRNIAPVPPYNQLLMVPYGREGPISLVEKLAESAMGDDWHKIAQSPGPMDGGQRGHAWATYARHTEEHGHRWIDLCKVLVWTEQPSMTTADQNNGWRKAG